MFKKFLIKTGNWFKKSAKQKVPVWVFIVSVLLVISIVFGGSFLIVSNSKATKTAKKIIEIDRLIQKNYIDEIDYNKLDTTVLSAYMAAIEDKYAFYKSSEDAEAVSDSFDGNNSGIGVTVFFSDNKDALVVFRVDKDSPADKAGIKVGDNIVAVDGTTVKKLGYEKSVTSIRRELGETVLLTLLRDGKEKKINVTFSEFVRQSVYTEKYGDLGYMCFTAFNSATVAQFKQAISDFKEENVKGLIFDLRDNGGGTVDSVCKILDVLVGECNLMTTEYSDGERKVNYKSDKKDIDLPMTVLVNGDTASASELFTANLRHQKNAKIIGDTTYGKGVVQRTYFLKDNSCIRFTVGKFYSSDNKCYDKIGIAPDYEVSFSNEELKNRYTLGKKDPYISKAIEVLKEGK